MSAACIHVSFPSTAFNITSCLVIAFTFRATSNSTRFIEPRCHPARRTSLSAHAPDISTATYIEVVESLLDSPSIVMLGEGPGHRGHLRRAVLQGEAQGNLMHDAHIAALLLEHGVTEFLSVDRDFARFPGLRARNPFRKK